MPTRIGSRHAGNLEIDGSPCLPFRWSRFSAVQTTITKGRKLYRDLILNNIVSCSVAAPCTHRDVVEQIARQSSKQIPYGQTLTVLWGESLPDPDEEEESEKDDLENMLPSDRWRQPRED